MPVLVSRFKLPKRLSRGALILGLLAMASCARVPRDMGERRLLVPGCSEDLLAQSELQEALELIQKEKYRDAREVMNGLLKEREASGGVPPSVLFLGVLELLEKGTRSGMEARKSYFEACARKFPAGPCRDNAERIVRLLEKNIARARREEKRKQEMNRTIEKQTEEIQTLKYQIQKLEEIQQETDEQRESLELK